MLLSSSLLGCKIPLTAVQPAYMPQSCNLGLMPGSVPKVKHSYGAVWLAG